MSDGFTTPDPAGVPSANEANAEDFPAAPDDPDPDDDLVVVERDASCEACIHSDVCAVYQRFEQTLEQSFHGVENAPVTPEKLAWACELYETRGDGE